MHPGKNVGQGNDFTLYSLIEGIVMFEKTARMHRVIVVPFEDYVIPEGQRMVEGSRRHRRLSAIAEANAATVAQ